MSGFVHSTGYAPELLYPGLAELWGTEYKQHPKKYDKFFQTKNSSKAFEKEQELSGFTTAGVKIFMSTMVHVTPTAPTAIRNEYQISIRLWIYRPPKTT